MKKKKSYSRNGHHHVHRYHLVGIIRCVVHAILFRHRRRLLSPLLSAVSACILLLIAAFSLLSPAPSASFPHLRYNAWDRKSMLGHGVVFRIPTNGGEVDRELWSSKDANIYYGCSNASGNFKTAETKTDPDRVLLIATSGGLNQQRTGITDSVVAAYILNATLAVPKLDQKSYWKDSSEFDEIFDVDWFISSLSKDVKIIKQFPTTGRKIVSMRVPRKCTLNCYESRVLPVLNKKHVIQLSKFDYRLSNRLDTELQKLRCRVNYHALKFTDPILEMGNRLVERMRVKSKHFIALHLRFEPDMLAFSGCYYGGGDKERTELGAIRKRWKSLHASNPDKGRRHGRCPLTPEEVGLMLRALGYGSDVHIYLASGEVYGGEETLAPLKALFPHYHSKETLATKEELAPFLPYSSRMAALDYVVCDESNVFVTNNNGNMARILAGRRRYFGHKPTIRPNAKKLYPVFMNRTNMSWEDFASRIRKYQIGFMGDPNEVRPGTGEFHENPAACICEDSEVKSRKLSSSQNQTRIDADELTDEQFFEDNEDWNEMDEVDQGNESQ